MKFGSLDKLGWKCSKTVKMFFPKTNLVETMGRGGQGGRTFCIFYNFLTHFLQTTRRYKIYNSTGFLERNCRFYNFITFYLIFSTIYRILAKKSVYESIQDILILTKWHPKSLDLGSYKRHTFINSFLWTTTLTEHFGTKKNINVYWLKNKLEYSDMLHHKWIHFRSSFWK